ncbi:abortive infection family protein [Roseomonas sp. HJA6]|uniref:Abortive infection family protein n=1 Tax=Roseomonas alba TaxID=2846776 RepID=A0ABS7ADU3_9PROT|nr:abortive infection family protein [Neoroseomonas alba]
MPKLWGFAAECLKLAPSQHHEESFKVIPGSCQQIVNRLGALRNRISDAHGLRLPSTHSRTVPGHPRAQGQHLKGIPGVHTA